MTTKLIPAESPADGLYHAGMLNVGHIGSRMRFIDYNPTTEVVRIITAELRQVSHNGGETTMNYGLGADNEITVDHDFPVWIGPCADLSEVSNYLAPAHPLVRDKDLEHPSCQFI